jgi:hypothetical protein
MRMEIRAIKEPQARSHLRPRDKTPARHRLRPYGWMWEIRCRLVPVLCCGASFSAKLSYSQDLLLSPGDHLLLGRFVGKRVAPGAMRSCHHAVTPVDLTSKRVESHFERDACRQPTRSLKGIEFCRAENGMKTSGINCNCVESNPTETHLSIGIAKLTNSYNSLNLPQTQRI